jgi:methionine biosynthesis protein MetW
MEPKLTYQASSPDEAAAGLIQGTLNPFRYEGHTLDPDEVAGIVVSMVPTGAKVLDVGCGSGEVAAILRDICRAHVVGIEPDPERAERSRERGLQVHMGYLNQKLIREVGLFDIVLFADVLEHLANPQPMLLLCREALQPGGAVIVSVPNVAHWSVRANLFFRGKFKYEPSGIMDATHLRWFTEASIKSLVAASGFKVAEYRATANAGLIDNACRRPLSWLPVGFRARFLRLASRCWPTLFGAQHVLKAEML